VVVYRVVLVCDAQVVAVKATPEADREFVGRLVAERKTEEEWVGDKVY
jgi:hypothetical protein